MVRFRPWVPLVPVLDWVGVNGVGADGLPAVAEVVAVVAGSVLLAAGGATLRFKLNLSVFWSGLGNALASDAVAGLVPRVPRQPKV